MEALLKLKKGRRECIMDAPQSTTQEKTNDQTTQKTTYTPTPTLQDSKEINLQL